jgi:hypothetical protein
VTEIKICLRFESLVPSLVAGGEALAGFVSVGRLLVLEQRVKSGFLIKDNAHDDDFGREVSLGVGGALRLATSWRRFRSLSASTAAAAAAAASAFLRRSTSSFSRSAFLRSSAA